MTASHQALRPDERRYRALISATSEFVWRCSAGGLLVAIDDAWLALTGMPRDQVDGWGWLSAVLPEDREAYQRSWLRAVAGGMVFEHEYRIRARDGEVRWFLDRAVPVRDDDGRLIEWIGTGQDITDRKSAERELEQQRGQYRTLVESTAAILWEADPDTFAITFVSGEAESILGYPVERWTGEPRFWLDHIHPEDRDWVLDYCARATAQHSRHGFDYRMIAADGRLVWLRDEVTVLVEDGRPSKLVGVMVDITPAKETARALEYVSGLQQVLVEVSRNLVAPAADPDRDPVAEALARIGACCEADRSYLLRSDGRSMSMVHESCAEGVPSLAEQLQDIPRERAINQMAAIERRELLHLPRVADLGPGWEVEKARLTAQGVRSMVLVPVISRGTPWGVIGFDSDTREREWCGREIRVLQSLADIIGATIERDSAEQARRDSEARLGAIADHLPGNVFQVVREPDGELRLTYLSASVEAAFEIDRERALADFDTVLATIHPDDRIVYRQALEHSARTLEPHDVQFRLSASDGEVRWGRAIGQPRASEDDTVTWDGVCIDETARKTAEDRLHESQALLEIAGRAARVGGWQVDCAGDRVRFSDEVCEIYDVPRGTTMATDDAVLYAVPECRAHMRAVLDACAAEGIPFDEELEVVTAVGRRAWVRVIGEAVRDEAGAISHLRGAVQDVTASKQTEQEARRLAERLTTTLESITDAFFTVDRAWRFTYVNGEAERLLKRDRRTLLGRSWWEEFSGARGTAMEHGFRRAMRENRTVSLEEFSTPLSLWLEIHAYPSEEGLAVYFRDISARKKAEDDIHFLALYDPLTRLPNRRLLVDRLQRAMTTTSGGALAFLDIDDFKTLNDTLGHHVGDRLLQQVAKRLTDTMRAGTTVARFGGDEFAVILGELGDRTEPAEVRRAGEEILAALNRPYNLAEHDRYSTVSIGLAQFVGEQGDSADDVIKRADLAMYRAKEGGRSSVRVFEPGMRAALSSRVALEASLRRALEDDAIVPHYQPQVDGEGRLIGVEALARWHHPDRGAIPPSQFIAVAEETGLILPLGRSILRHACGRIAAWSDRGPGPGPLPVAVNISARQFHQREFVDEVLATLAEADADPAGLRLELTESFLLEDLEDTITKMAALKEAGVGFSLDDFGTGYSSLLYLKRLSLDQIKIDQAFVRDIHADSNDAAIVQSIIVLARNLGLEVIAEGVETQAARDLLAQYGCGAYQGYLFSHPLPTASFEALLEAPYVGEPGPNLQLFATRRATE